MDRDIAFCLVTDVYFVVLAFGDEDDSLMTDDLSEAEEEDTDQGEGEPEEEEEEMFVTPGKDTSMYHSAIYLPQENEHK